MTMRMMAEKTCQGFQMQAMMQTRASALQIVGNRWWGFMPFLTTHRMWLNVDFFILI